MFSNLVTALSLNYFNSCKTVVIKSFLNAIKIVYKYKAFSTKQVDKPTKIRYTWHFRERLLTSMDLVVWKKPLQSKITIKLKVPVQ